MVKRKKYKETEAQILLAIHLKEMGIQTVPEHRFDAERDWRWDLCSLHHRIAFEISGGNWTGGHRRGKAQEDEYDKINAGQLQGWRVMQWTNRQVLLGEAKAFMEKYLGKEGQCQRPGGSGR